MILKLNIEELNENQRKAVYFKDGVCQVCACAGVGKTRVLTYRIANLILNEKINPNNILVATFSKKAALEMKERLKKLIGDQLNDLTIGTFHSIGWRILYHEYNNLNHPLKNVFSNKILQKYEQKTIIEKGINKFKEKYDKEFGEIDYSMFNFNIIISKISLLKSKLINPVTYFKKAVLAEDFLVAYVYHYYETEKFEKKKIDFDDMLFQLHQLFNEYPKILEKYQNQFHYILVDEAQDNVFSQYELIRLLGEPQNNIMIVGDDDQSLYGFRGAEPEEFINFKNYYPNLEIINLEQNYRSCEDILNVANEVIEKNTNRLNKKMVPTIKNQLDNPVNVSIYLNENREAKQIVDLISQHQKNGFKLKDFAILYRINSQSKAIEDELVKNQIPYVIYNGVSFYDRKEVKDLVDYLRLIVNPHSNNVFEKLINVPFRYIGKSFINELKEISKSNKISLFQALEYVLKHNKSLLNNNQYLKMKKFFDLISNYHQSYRSRKLPDLSTLLNNLVKEIDYLNYIQNESNDEEDVANDKIDNIHTLINSSSKFDDIDELLNHISKIKSKNNSVDAVQLMTIHASKGLEFKIVFLIGLSEGILPHKYSIETCIPYTVEEERRLFYVGVTRAKERLYLSHIQYYNMKKLDCSRFIYESTKLNNLINHH